MRPDLRSGLYFSRRETALSLQGFAQFANELSKNRTQPEVLVEKIHHKAAR